MLFHEGVSVVKMFFILCILSVFLVSSVHSQGCQRGVVASGVNQDEQNYIVNLHNKLRKEIANGQVRGQPKGINLKRLYWDKDLAAEAQNIATPANGHVTVHDKRWSWIGQNIYQSTAWDSRGPQYIPNESNWTAPIMSWFDEHDVYTYPNPASQNTGHYTQVVWAETRYVGCGYTGFDTNDNQKDKYYVCNYAPGGNVNGQAPYLTGSSNKCDNLC